MPVAELSAGEVELQGAILRESKRALHAEIHEPLPENHRLPNMHRWSGNIKNCKPVGDVLLNLGKDSTEIKQDRVV